MRTEYKKIVRNELTSLNVQLPNFGYYYNDICHNNATSTRRIKVEVDRKLTDFELGTLEAALSARFNQKVNAKNYKYCCSDCVVLHFRK